MKKKKKKLRKTKYKDRKRRKREREREIKKIPLGAEDGENIKGGREGVRTARLRMVSDLSPVVDVTSIPSFLHSTCSF